MGRGVLAAVGLTIATLVCFPVAPNDAAVIGYSVCQTFDADPTTAYKTFMAREAAFGANAQQAAFVKRTAVQTICPRPNSHLP